MIGIMTAPICLSRKQAAKRRSLRWEKLSEFLAFAGLPTLSPVQRVAYLAYEYQTHIIEMAGHHDYFSTCCSPDYSEVVSALQSVGAVEQASILTTALEAVYTASERAPREHANRFLAGVEYADFVQFDSAMQQCSRPVPECLMDYLDKHETEFIEWKP